MLHTISLKNFKAFADLPPITLKPITLFCGTNSCGKSSLLQSLLLWKQTLESRNYDQSLLMNGRLIHLGAFSNAIHKHLFSSPMGFDFTFEFTRADLYRTQSRFRYPWHILMREFFYNLPEHAEKSTKFRFKYSVELETTATSVETSFTGSIIAKSVTIDASAELSDGKLFPGANINITKMANSSEYEMTWRNLSTPYQSKVEVPGTVYLSWVN